MPPRNQGFRPVISLIAEAVHVSSLGIVIYTALILLSIHYYLERTVFVDISFHLFSLITTETWAIQNFRFGALFTQALPLLGIKLGLSLKAVAILYSISFPVLYLGIFLVVVRCLHQPRLGLLLLGYNTIMVTDTFYWIQSELSQGVAFLILYMALLFRLHDRSAIRSNPVWDILHPIILFILVFFHPLIIFVYAFLWTYFWSTRTIERRILSISGVAFGSMYAIKLLFFKTAYDSKSMEGIHNLKQIYSSNRFGPILQKFASDFIHDHYLILIGLMLVLISSLFYRKWSSFILVAGAFVGYTLLVHISYPNNPVKFYYENLLLPLSIFILTPLIFQVLPSKIPKSIWTTLVLICIIRVFVIQQSHTLYTERVAWMRNYMVEAKRDGALKLIVDDNVVPMDTLLMTWATPYEFWLLSTLETGITASIVITGQPEETEWAAGDGNVFISKWGVFPYDQLPTPYFHFQDHSPYRFILKE